MFVKIRVMEIGSEKEYVEIGKFKTIFYDEDTDCALLSLKGLNDIYIPCSKLPCDYDTFCDRLFNGIQNGVEAIEIIAPALDVDDSFFDSIGDNTDLVELFSEAAPVISGDIRISF